MYDFKKIILGIYVRTTNKNNQSFSDMKNLWERFYFEKVFEKITHKYDDKVYCIYTDYDKDDLSSYTAIIGCSVNSEIVAENGMILCSLYNGIYLKYTAHGNILEGAVGLKWSEIWKLDLDRNYRTDFEVYDERANNLQNAEVDIFVGVK